GRHDDRDPDRYGEVAAPLRDRGPGRRPRGGRAGRLGQKGHRVTAPPHPAPASAAWLGDKAAARGPERLLTASRDRIRSPQQRRAWWPARRTRSVSRTTPVAAVVPAVVAFAG